MVMAGTISMLCRLPTIVPRRCTVHGKVRALEMLAKHLGMYEIRREPTSRVGDVSVLTDEELDELIQKERAALAASDGRDDD